MQNSEFEDLLDAVKIGDLDYVDRAIEAFDIAIEIIDWALEEGLLDDDDNIRDFAATLLDDSEVILTKSDMEKIKNIMAKDKYLIVQFRLAVALYKAGDESSEVEEMMQRAKDDPDVGELAQNYL
jgi:hypothetical protein